MAEDDLYRDAGRVATEVMDKTLKKVVEGARLFDVAVFAEKEIIDSGARPAFPINISINERAAHYTPDIDDSLTFSKGDLVKIDIGVHIEGHIGDIARSKAIGGGHKDLIKASEAALEGAVKAIRPGVATNEIGRVVEEIIKGFGFKPIINLTGHMLTLWNLHGGVTVPNVRTMHGYKFKKGDVFAIEPFSTDGAGRVVDEPKAMIFRFLKDRPVRLREARIILGHVKNEYPSLPFAERWIANLVPKIKLGMALRTLVSSKAIHAYHVLKEKDNGLVAQSEDSIRVTENGCEVLTEK